MIFRFVSHLFRVREKQLLGTYRQMPRLGEVISTIYADSQKESFSRSI